MDKERLIALLRDKNATLAVAESCTGGLIAKTLTDVPGASAVFLGGVVSYTNEVKMRVLGVSADTIDSFGVVSAEVACEMADGVRSLLKSDFSLSVTGYAGPGGDQVGLVFIGISYGDTVRSEKCIFEGSRDDIRRSACEHALRMLIEVV